MLPGAPPDAENQIVLSDVFGPPSTPAQDLNMSLFLLDEAGVNAFGSRGFTNFKNDALKSYCYITHDKPGFASTFVDGLSPTAIYTIWLSQG